MLWAYAQAVKFPLDEGLVLREAGLSVAPAWRESSHTCDGLDADTLYTRALPPVSVVDDVMARRSSQAVFMGTSWEAMAGDAGTHDGGSASSSTGAGGAGAGDGSAAHAAVLPPDWVEADGSVLVRACIRAAVAAMHVDNTRAPTQVPVPEVPVARGSLIVSASFNPVHDGVCRVI